MLSRLGLTEEAAEAPKLSVVAPAEDAEPKPPAEPVAEDPLDDILSRFGIAETPAPKAPRPRPVLTSVETPAADLDIPEPPSPAEPMVLRDPEWVAEPTRARAAEPAPERAPEPEPAIEPAPRQRPSQAEELEEMRRQLRARSRPGVPRELPGLPPGAIPSASPARAPKRRKKGELSKVRLVIWLAAIAASGWMTYTVVRASVEHDAAQQRPPVTAQR